MSTRSKAWNTRKVTSGLVPNVTTEWRRVHEAETSFRQVAPRVKELTPVHQHEDDREKKALRDEVLRLTQTVEKQQAEHEDDFAVLYDERIKTNKDRRDAIRRADDLKVSLIAEKKKTKEMEICSAKQMEQISKLQAALLKVESNLEEQRRQWEQEKLCLLTKNQETSEVEQLKYQLQDQRVKHEDQVAALYNELLRKNKESQDAMKRAELLKEDLTVEKNRAKEAEDCLAQQKEETSNLQAALVLMERTMEDQQQQWEQEKSHFLIKEQERDELEQLVKQLESQKAEAEQEIAALRLEQGKNNRSHKVAARKVIELKISLVAEKTRAKEAEDCLAQQKEETSNLQAALVLMERTLEDQRQQWEQDKSHFLIKEQERDELEQLVKQLESQKAEAEQEIAALCLEQQENNQSHQDAARKVIELEISLVAEKTRTKEAEDCLADQVKESCEKEAALVKMEQDLENQRQLWAQEKSSLLTEQQKAVRDVEAAREDVLEVLHDERQQWQTEKSCLLEIVATTKELLKEAEVKRKTSTLNLIEKLKILQQEMDKLEESKPKKKSFRRKIAKIFKRSKKAPSQSEN